MVPPDDRWDNFQLRKINPIILSIYCHYAPVNLFVFVKSVTFGGDYFEDILIFRTTVKPVSLSPVSLSFLKNLAKLLFFSLFSVTLLIAYFYEINFSYHFLGRNTVKNPIKRPWIMRQINRKNKRALYLLIISQE